jgi:hypothetical protein
MPLTWFDRLRIERLVWTLDHRLYDLPHASRVAHRREVRQNLLSAAEEIGAGAALRNLGGSAQLASAYLAAEFGDRPRHSWVAAILFAATTLLVATSIFSDAGQAFGAGIVAADPDAGGTYRWGGIPYLQTTVTYTLEDGRGTFDGGAFTPLFWAVWLAVTVVVGRLWRVRPYRLASSSA